MKAWAGVLAATFLFCTVTAQPVVVQGDSVRVAIALGQRGLWARPLASAKYRNDPWPIPQVAARLSLLCPGLGQAYNRSFWKIPVVYAALGTAAFFVVQNHLEYRRYASAYRWRTDGDPTTLDPFVGRYADNSLRSIRDFYRRNRDFAVILGALGYALTGIEAYVDAHLKHFQITDELSMLPYPWFFVGNRPVTGCTVSLKFR
jgi:hypothetical protein